MGHPFVEAPQRKNHSDSINLAMKMKVPTSPVGNGYDPCDYDDDLDIPSDYETDNDFSEYLWMENEEEFDKMEMQRLEEEDLMKECEWNAMLEDELEAELALADQLRTEELCEILSTLSVEVKNVENSTLNPLAAEFIPTVSLVLPASF